MPDPHLPAPPASDLAIAGIRPLPDQVSEAIVLMIASKQLRPGQRLLETELASRLNTSRMPLREAIRRLEAQGIVASIPYRGTRVAEFGEREQAQVAEVRIALERLVFTQSAAAIRKNPARLAQLDQVIAEMRDCVAAGDRLALNRADVAFHLALCRLTDNAMLLTLWQAIAPHVLIAFGLSNDRYPSSSAVLDQHLRLRAALTTGHPKELESLAARHVTGADIISPEAGLTITGGVLDHETPSARPGRHRSRRRSGAGTSASAGRAGPRAEPTNR